MILTALSMAFSAIGQPFDHLSFPIVKSHTIIVSAEAWPREMAAAVPPPGVGDDDANAV